MNFGSKVDDDDRKKKYRKILSVRRQAVKIYYLFGKLMQQNSRKVCQGFRGRGMWDSVSSDPSFAFLFGWDTVEHLHFIVYCSLHTIVQPD